MRVEMKRMAPGHTNTWYLESGKCEEARISHEILTAALESHEIEGTVRLLRAST